MKIGVTSTVLIQSLQQQIHTLTQHESLLNNLEAIFTHFPSLGVLSLCFYRHKHVVDLSTKLPMDTKIVFFFVTVKEMKERMLLFA